MIFSKDGIFFFFLVIKLVEGLVWLEVKDKEVNGNIRMGVRWKENVWKCYIWYIETKIRLCLLGLSFRSNRSRVYVLVVVNYCIGLRKRNNMSCLS